TGGMKNRNRATRSTIATTVANPPPSAAGNSAAACSTTTGYTSNRMIVRRGTDANAPNHCPITRTPEIAVIATTTGTGVAQNEGTSGHAATSNGDSRPGMR